MVFVMWLLIAAACVGLIVWVASTVRALKRDGLEHARPIGLDTLKSSIRWFAIFPMIALIAAGMLSTAPLITSSDASEPSLATAVTGVKRPANSCCDQNEPAQLADGAEQVVAGAQSFGALAGAGLVAVLCVRLGGNTVKSARRNSAAR